MLYVVMQDAEGSGGFRYWPADLAGLPPLLVYAGSDEVLLDDAQNFVERAAAAGCSVAGRCYAGKPPLPSVAGREGVGILDGGRVYFDAPVAPFGSMAERALVDPRARR